MWKTVYYTEVKINFKPDKLSQALNKSGRDYTRELARQRDNRQCQKCSKKWQEGKRRFDIHHINGCGYKSQHYDRIADLPNLITYCHKCHLNLHSVKQKMKTKTGMNKISDKKSSHYK